MPYEFKVNYARIRAWEFYNECGKRDLDCYVSVGGLDSITLFFFLKSIGIDVPAVSVSLLEDVSIQKIHKQIGVISLPPAVRTDGTRWNKQKLIQEFGFPVLSKEIARKIELLQNPTPNNKTIRHAIVTGETGEYGGFQKHSKMKLAQKWLEKFGGLENEEEGVNYQIAPFKVSSKCCYYLKEKPCSDWAKEHNCVPYLGLMASEGGRREKSLMLNGCNYFGKGMSDKKRHTIWINERIWVDVLSHYKSDNCSTQNEFVENALRFYIGYLNTKSAGAFLPQAISSVMIGTMDNYAHRVGSQLYKLAVEQNLCNHILAEDTDMDARDYQLLRGRSVREVQSTNGRISFKEALDFQKTV